MSSKKNYYEILGIDKNATTEDIKKAFKKSSLKWHPDRWATGTDEEKKVAEEKFKEINEAHSILSDPQKKKNYDTYGDPNGGGSIFDNMDMDDFFSPFRNNDPRIVKGENIQTTVNVTLEEMFNGSKKTIKYQCKITCPDCNGSGLSSNGKREFCPHCNGTGRIRKVSRNGYSTFVQESVCHYCQGVGQKIINPCKKCNGSGLSYETKEITIDIPVGIFNGAAISMEGYGSAPYDGKGINGDLIILFNEIKHPLFKRKDDDIYSEIELNIVDALLGTEIQSETIDGSKVKFNLSEITKDGHILKLTGKGMRNVRMPSHRGNHYITIKYKYPNNLSEKQIELLKEFNEIEKNK